jgi:hypothetical protein
VKVGRGGKLGTFKDFGSSELISVAVLLLSAVGTFTSVQTRMQDDTSRIVALEHMVVPRAEQEARENEHQKREVEWNQRLDRIESKLDALIIKKSRD